MGCDPNALTTSSALKCDIYLNYFKLFKSALKSPTGPFVDPMMKKKKSTFCFSAVLGLQKSWAGSGGKSHAAHPGRDPLALASGADSRRANGDVVAGYSCGVGGAPPVGSGSRVMTLAHHYGVTQRSATALDPLCSAHPPRPLAPTGLLTVSVVLRLPECHRVGTLWFLI